MSFDPPSNPEGATGRAGGRHEALLGARLQPGRDFLTAVDGARRPRSIPKATKRRPSGERTPITGTTSRRSFDGPPATPTARIAPAAGRLLPGKVLGGFRYEGTRPDDPNDIVPHEHRRELRALRVFGAWTNLTDMKAGNTLDTIVSENGRGVVRHYLQDVGSTFGMGANGPHDWDEGWEHVYDGAASRRRLLTFGFGFSPWQTADYENYPAVGRFEGDTFEPETWKPRAPTAAYFEMRADDAFWAARRVMAFSDEMIRAAVKTGEFSDPKAEQYLADVLIKRRDKIGRAYLTKINPIVEPGSSTLGRADVRERGGRSMASPPRRRGYAAAWYAFDNATGESRPLGQTTGARAPMQPPSGLPTAVGAHVRVDLTADHPEHPSWKEPVRAFFVRQAAGWKLVGFERLPGTP